MDKEKELSFSQACMDFFGKKNKDQTLSEFMQEIKQLTDKDRSEIAAGLIQLGYKIKDVK